MVFIRSFELKSIDWVLSSFLSLFALIYINRIMRTIESMLQSLMIEVLLSPFPHSLNSSQGGEGLTNALKLQSLVTDSPLPPLFSPSAEITIVSVRCVSWTQLRASYTAMGLRFSALLPYSKVDPYLKLGCQSLLSRHIASLECLRKRATAWP